MTMANPNIDGGKEFDWGARIGRICEIQRYLPAGIL